MPVPRTRTLGLTGGIGSGKSTVGQFLAQAGAALIDADAIARAATGPGGAAMPAVRAQFGEAFVTAEGALDRERMRVLAFADPGARARLERIVHPLVGQAIAAQTQAAIAAGSPLVVLDIPLLAESQRWAPQLDAVLVVDCHPDTQVARVVARSGLAPEAVRAIMAAQASRAQRRAVADMVLCNDGIGLEALRGLALQAGRRFGL